MEQIRLLCLDGENTAQDLTERARQIARINLECFSDPDGEQVVLKLLQQEGMHFIVAELEGECIAYCSFLCVVDECQVINVATHPMHRGRGIAGSLVKKMQSIAVTLGCTVASLEVRRSNAAAISVYNACGFECVGERRRFYKNPAEDALIMLCSLSS